MDEKAPFIRTNSKKTAEMLRNCGYEEVPTNDGLHTYFVNKDTKFFSEEESKYMTYTCFLPI